MRPVHEWFRKTFDDPQIVLLVVLLLGLFLALTFFARALAPVIAAMVIAFVLEGSVQRLSNWGMGRTWAAGVVFLGFIGFMAGLVVIVLPPLTQQIVRFSAQLPEMVGGLRDGLAELPEAYPALISQDQVARLFDGLEDAFAPTASALTVLTDSVTGVITVVVYSLLILLMLFFFLKDKPQILAWLASFLPKDRPLADRVWHESIARAGDYARGKVYEILIVAVAAWITYWAVGLNFITLLAVITGLSVLIPYIGAAAATVPVALVALFQWGLGTETIIAISAYLILQALDGNLLAPLLFSEVVKLHPVAVILAILIFGSVWGLWGVFFAVPLATLAHAVIKAWPRDGVAAP